jgi:hypothetical protein
VLAERRLLRMTAAAHLRLLQCIYIGSHCRPTTDVNQCSNVIPHVTPSFCTLPATLDHFGTLIVCLPSPFKGGQLVVRHIDHNSTSAPHTRTYDWSSSGDTTTQDLRWAAFYTDTGTPTQEHFVWSLLLERGKG